MIIVVCVEIFLAFRVQLQVYSNRQLKLPMAVCGQEGNHHWMISNQGEGERKSLFKSKMYIWQSLA